MIRRFNWNRDAWTSKISTNNHVTGASCAAIPLHSERRLKNFPDLCAGETVLPNLLDVNIIKNENLNDDLRHGLDSLNGVNGTLEPQDPSDDVEFLTC